MCSARDFLSSIIFSNYKNAVQKYRFFFCCKIHFLFLERQKMGKAQELSTFIPKVT